MVRKKKTRGRPSAEDCAKGEHTIVETIDNSWTYFVRVTYTCKYCSYKKVKDVKRK